MKNAIIWMGKNPVVSNMVMVLLLVSGYISMGRTRVESFPDFSIDQIKSYYENNKDNYKEIYKSVKIFELNPKALTGIDEFNNIFFKKIDEIDDIII